VTPNPARFNSARHYYYCTTRGTYFFGLSAGVPAGVQTLVRLTKFGFGVGEMLRMSSTTNGMTTLAAKFFIDCDPNIPISVELVSGRVAPGPANTQEKSLISFTAFHYTRADGTSTAWSVYRNSNWTAGAQGMNPFPFDGSSRKVIGSATWNQGMHEVTVNRYGNYYIYVSGGTQPNRAMGLTVQRNGRRLFGVYRSTTNFNGVDSLGHGLVVILNAGDRLKVVAEPNTSGYSGSEMRHASFFGFLII